MIENLEFGEGRNKARRIQPLNFFSGKHAHRISLLSYLMALELGLNRGDADLLRLVAPTRRMNPAITPEDMAVKPGARYTDSDTDGIDPVSWQEPGGFEIFKKSDNEIMKAAALVAHQRHEHWDGNGYPRGLKGEEIHIFARIAGLANAFDSLVQGRFSGYPYNIAQITALIRGQRGRWFSPRLVDIFLHNLDEFLKISSRYHD